VRTAAQGVTVRELRRELKFLLKIWGRIRRFAQRESAPRLIYEEYDLVLRVARDMLTPPADGRGDAAANSILVDSKDDYHRIMKFLRMVMPHLRSKVKLYRGSKGLFEEYGVEKEIQKLYEKKVQLKSKGSIIIEQTESLVAIDVNTAGFAGKRDPEETAFVTNMEAARETARQIRLRDLGGIIIIDFIDMELKDHRHKVHRALEEALKRDKAKTEVLNVSSIGVVEMTRQRMGRSLNAMVFQDCPYCRGEGFIKSAATVAIDVYRRLRKVLSESRAHSLDVDVHPDVSHVLLSSDKGLIALLEKQYGCRIRIRGIEGIHREDISINPSY
jgi:ribonuclease G